jgi:hypothetical protein
MKGDFSRSTFNLQRPYSSVRMQQGRVPVDADWNEQVDISDYQRRRAIADIIGGCCIPESQPDSFRVSFGGGVLRVQPGRAWVRGILAERGDEQTIPLPTTGGRYVVYLEVFERHVTAIEDPEIREVALGGPDTATRTVTVCRARIAPVEGNQTCADLRDFVPPGETTGQLTASTGAQPADTPCVVPLAAGYARLENQLYRVEIHNGGTIGAATAPTFKWSRDNGSIAAEWLQIDGNEIVIPDPGRDDVLGFHDNRWIEIGHDDLDIAGEPGPIVEVVSRHTDSEGRFRLEFDAHGQTVPDPTTLKHPKVRRWDHDAGSDVATGAIPIAAADTAIALEGGIEVQFSAGAYRAGDFWMIPARTFSGASIGDILWPRDGGGHALAQPPHGVPRFFCKLGVVTVSGNSAQVVDECRRTFPSLCGLDTRASTCCTVTVGRSGADVTTIAEALQRLPPEGGEICVLPGRYDERVVIDGRHNIRIHGCPGQTLVVGPDANPAFSLRNVEDIGIRSLAIESLQGEAIAIETAHRVTLEELLIAARDRSAISAIDASELDLLDSIILLAPGAGAAFAVRPVGVYLAGEDLSVERTEIVAESVEKVERMHGGGLQIGGGSEQVLIRDNVIDGGFGPGIVLGSVTARPNRPILTGVFEAFATRRETDPVKVARSNALDEAEAHYKQLKRQPGTTGIFEVPGGGFGGVRPTGRGVVSDGNLANVKIIGNQIRKMGASGITTAHFFDLVEGEGDFITVHGLEIDGNRIEECLRVRQQPVSEQMAEDTAVGGIALADGEDVVIRDNAIERNGSQVRMPTCGIFLLHSVGLEIHRNHIRHNGMPPQAETPTALGRRGGIVIGFAEVPTREVRLGAGEGPRRRQDGTPAISIQDNVIIAPEGRAIEAVSLGAVAVQGNQLTSLGSDFHNRSTRSPMGLDVAEGSPLGVFTSAFGGAVVFIFNLGVSNELYFQLFGFSGLNIADTQPQPADPFEDRGVLVGGNIQFVDNQVVLDALDSVTTFALSAITLLTLDDLALSDNQSDCDLVNDVVATHALAIAFSTRTTSNRFKAGVFNALYSAVTIAFLNTTADNQGTHCFVRIGNPVPHPGQNTVLLEVFSHDACANAANLEKKLQKTIFGV